MNKFYYWANDTRKNSGEGILALNFLNLLKKKFTNHKFINLNKLKKKNNFFYNYFTPFFGVILIWKYYFKRKKISYINYLPIWNFLVLLLLPKKTILGPITGTITKTNIIYNILKKVGIYILKGKKRVLFSHNQFINEFSDNSYNYFNFLFYKFKFKYKTTKKKFDLIFYFKKNNNKGNRFLINLIKNIPEEFKVAVIGDNLNISKKNIKNFGTLSRKKALKIINLSKYSLSSKENHFSFFVLDCLSKGLCIFYNKDLKLYKDITTNMFLPIDFNDLENSIKNINEMLFKKKSQRKTFKIKLRNFNNYLAGL